jgi:hypothetical protein
MEKVAHNRELRKSGQKATAAGYGQGAIDLETNKSSQSVTYG